TQQECDALREKNLAQTQQECDALREEAQAQAQSTMDVFFQEIRQLLDKYPVIAEYLDNKYNAGEDSTGA
ncbi:MAG: hypothetical protein LUI13_10250, partial [Lachnospiraceae bacterium]|nr:hypothetical protein [Lachnospiraceae bacterium]